VHLKPMLAVVTNIDADHMSTYDGDIEKLKSSFIEFLHNLPFYGLAVVCGDDPGVNDVLADIGRSVTTYGINDDADVRAVNMVFKESTTEFDVVRARQPGSDPAHDDTSTDVPVPLHITLRLPGEHNVRNALAAIAVAEELQVGAEAIVKALKEFEGIDRRFQRMGDVITASGTITLVDDYGHHPTEIAATLSAAKSSWPARRVVLVFQPHRYSRTRDLMDDFATVLSDADALVLLDVYAAGEEPIASADGRAMARAVRTRGSVEPVFVESLENLLPVLLDVIEDGDILLTMGAGDIGAYAAELPELISNVPALKVHQ
jgi:UDP-N-acetylmuramate--alanine ligase